MPVSVTQSDRHAQGEVAIERVTGSRALRDFVELPYGLYRRDTYWVPPLRRDEYRRLSRSHNPFLAHADLTLWTARREGRIVGRIAAIDDRQHNAIHAERVTWFGFFEATDRAVAVRLLGAAEDHARSSGSDVIRGPANPSLHDSAGLLIDGFDDAPYVLMPYNPPSYRTYVEAAGFAKAKDLLAWDIDLSRPLGDRVRHLGERLQARHRARVRAVDLSVAGYERDLASLEHVYSSAWSRNWGFVPPTSAEMRQLASELRPVLDPDMVLFVEIDNQVVGCAVALPDVNQVLRRMNGRLWPLGVWHFFRRRRLIDRVRVLLVGVLPEYRRTGLYPLLIAELHRRGLARGYRRGEMSWTLEDNELVNAGIEAAGGRRSKTYRIYEKSVR